MSLFPFVADTENPNAMLCLLTIVSADSQQTLRVVNNNEVVNSGGHEFQPYAFTFILAGDTGDRQPSVQLQLDNVSQELMTELRRLYEPPEITAQLVWSNQPDVIERQLDFLRLSQIEYDSLSITGNMTPHTFLQERFPKGIFDGVQYADLFFSRS